MKEPKIVTEPGHTVSDEVRGECGKDLAELREVGLDPHLVRVHAGEDPHQYYFMFPTGQPSYVYRKKLAEAGFEVRQEMGEKMLAFYACRASRKTGAWN